MVSDMTVLWDPQKWRNGKPQSPKSSREAGRQETALRSSPGSDSEPGTEGAIDETY